MSYYLTLCAGFTLGWLLCALLGQRREQALAEDLQAAIDDRDAWRQTAQPLALAVVCGDCEAVYHRVHWACPACGSHQGMPLATWLGSVR